MILCPALPSDRITCNDVPLLLGVEESPLVCSVIRSVLRLETGSKASKK